MALIWLSEVLSEVYYGINFLVMFLKLETSNTNDFKKKLGIKHTAAKNFLTLMYM